MGCSEVTITRQGERPSVTFTRSGEIPSVKFTKSGGMNVRFGLVCGTNIGDGFLFASDGLLVTIEDGKLIVKQR